MKSIAHCSAFLLTFGFALIGCQEENLVESAPDNLPGANSPKNVLVTTYAGTGVSGLLNGPALQAMFYYPHSITSSADGTFYIADLENRQIRKITPEGIVSTVRCTSDKGTISFQFLEGVVVSPQGFLYLSDRNANIIYKLSASGVITVFAGGEEGYEDGQRKAAKFHGPTGLALSSDGTLYVADQSNHRIRKITPAGQVSTVAGSQNGFADGAALSAQFSFPHGISVAGDGALFVADQANHRIRKISPSGEVSTIAGSTEGFEDGSALSAKFNNPTYLALAPDGTVYVSDKSNQSIRAISTGGVVSTITSSLSFPHGITYNKGALFVSDYSHRIFKITLE